MKLYSLFTESHEKLMYEYFIPSLFKVEDTTNIDLVIKKIPQLCKSASFGDNGWFETMLIKAEYHIQSCLENMGQKFIYMDCDIQFFKPFAITMIEELADYDIACQNDVFPYENRTTYCAGLFICKANEKTLKFFIDLYKSMNYYKHNDQIALNQNLHQLKHKILSSNFYTISQTTNVLWDNNYNISNIPSNILVHHANWTHGIDNKIKLLNFIKSKQS